MRANHFSISILAGLLAALPLWGQNSIAVTCPGQAPRASSVDCFITLSLTAPATVDSLLFGLQVTPNGAAPVLDQGQLSFTDLIGGGYSTSGSTNNEISVLWAAFSPALSGQQLLGLVSFTLPSSAGVAQSYAVTITGAFASLSNSNVALSIGSPASVAVGTAFLSSVNPNTGGQGQTLSSVAIAGQNSNFVQGTTVAAFGRGITVNSLTVNGPASATASITIAGNAPAGPRDVSLTTGSEVATLNGGFTVTITNACDVGHYGTANVQDVQRIVNEATGHWPAADDLNHDGNVNVVEIQLVINAVMWQSCMAM